MKKQVHLIVTGKVQGVFYRSESAKYAQAHGIKGWAKNNEDDETVEIIAQGSEEALKNFVMWCWEGPAQARVDDVEERWEESREEFSKFEIRN